MRLRTAGTAELQRHGEMPDVAGTDHASTAQGFRLKGCGAWPIWSKRGVAHRHRTGRNDDKTERGPAMPFALFRRERNEPTIRALYGAIVAQARQPAFYAAYGVPDTVEGRFDMIVVHLALLVRRLRRDGESGRVIAQGAFDAFCADMDHNLREQGLSDVAVPRRMKSFGEAFYGRATAYDRALDAGDGDALAAALARNIFLREDLGHAGARRLAAYVVAAERMLADETAALAQGKLAFPDPAQPAAPPSP
jgi:cytochrome b pre-mRNA-processing protein 3